MLKVEGLVLVLSVSNVACDGRSKKKELVKVDIALSVSSVTSGGM